MESEFSFYTYIVKMQAETSYPAIVGRIIEYLRKEQNLNQDQLANQLGLEQSTWSRIERGQSGISLEQLNEVSRILNTTPHKILQDADSTKSEFIKKGIKVHSGIIAKPHSTMALIGLTALSVMILAIILKK